MGFIEKQPRKFGDRRDAVWVRDAPGLNVMMASLYPKRTDCEVYMNQEFDITELMEFIDRRNAEHPEIKTTVFHCIVTMVARILNECRLLNRFIQGRRVYQRDSISISFIAKRRFSDHSEEALMQYIPKGDDTLADVSRRIVGDVKEMREQSSAAGIDRTIDKIAHLPRPLLMLAVHIVRNLDFLGKVPKFLTEGDSNCATVMMSNLGSIKCPSVYHHLNNYGTTSIFITIGTIHSEIRDMPDGSRRQRQMLDIGATVDERIADGFYFAKSLKLIQYVCSNPRLLDRPLKENSNYDYK